LRKDLKRRKLISSGTLIASSLVKSDFSVALTRSKKLPEFVDFNVAPLKVGELRNIEIDGVYIFSIARRKREDIDRIEEKNERLFDPNSESSIQPDAANNNFRSIKKEYFVFFNACTHLGCRVFKMDREFRGRLPGDYHCNCHGANFDPAGRALGPNKFDYTRKIPNLIIPDYKYLTKFLIRVYVKNYWGMM
jgi:ubiquinol-cytochrome c reductase iron-sulfur subunit